MSLNSIFIFEICLLVCVFTEATDCRNKLLLLYWFSMSFGKWKGITTLPGTKHSAETFLLLYIAIFIRYSSTCKNASKIPKVTQVYIHSFTSQWLIGSALLLSQLMQKTEKSNPSVLWENLHINMQWQLSTVSSPERCSGFIVLFKIKQRDTFHIYNYSALCKYVLTT